MLERRPAVTGLVLAALAVVSCSPSAVVPEDPVPARSADAPSTAPRRSVRRDAASIEVSAGYPAGDYEVVEWVSWPTPGMHLLFDVACTPDVLRETASLLDSPVDAVYGYVEWREKGKRHCGGTAVRLRAPR